MTAGRRALLVVEDGNEYEEFARAFLGERHRIRAARSAQQALAAMAEEPADALLIDLRFERAAAADLVGDVRETAARLFSGDEARALRWLKDQQGTLILGVLRDAGYRQPAVFVHDFPARRLENLRRMYGAVSAVSGFDAEAIARALAEGA